MVYGGTSKLIVLQVHMEYRHAGGEDVVAADEARLLRLRASREHSNDSTIPTWQSPTWAASAGSRLVLGVRAARA